MSHRYLAVRKYNIYGFIFWWRDIYGYIIRWQEITLDVFESAIGAVPTYRPPSLHPTKNWITPSSCIRMTAPSRMPLTDHFNSILYIIYSLIELCIMLLLRRLVNFFSIFWWRNMNVMTWWPTSSTINADGNYWSEKKSIDNNQWNSIIVVSVSSC